MNETIALDQMKLRKSLGQNSAIYGVQLCLYNFLYFESSSVMTKITVFNDDANNT